MNFGLVGDGNIAKYHKAAIEHIGGKLIAIEDPKYGKKSVSILSDSKKDMSTLLLRKKLDYIVIASPTYLHRLHLLQALKNPRVKIIVEKPMVLPWEPTTDINDDRINIVLQLRWLPDLPKKANKIYIRKVRDSKYFDTWKGDARNTGGLFFNIFIHFIDLAIQLGADFEGIVTDVGEQLFTITQDHEIMFYINQSTIQNCYNMMYASIIRGYGVKPKDLYYLNWILHRNSEMFGYGRDGLNKSIFIPNELL